MTAVGALRIEHHNRGGCVVVAPVGVLGTGCYLRLRDALLAFLAERPVAVVVDLSGLQVTDAVVLSVFPAVAMVSATPPVPLMLAAAGNDLHLLLLDGAVPRFVPTFATLPAALAAAASNPTRRRHQVDLPCAPSTAQRARHWIRQQCLEWALPQGDPVDTVVLVASELVENMILHARTGGRLRLEQHRSGLTVAVSDGCDRPPVPIAPQPGQQVGGLAVIEALATVWGHWQTGGDGKVVWAVLPFPAARPDAGPPPHRTSTTGLRAGVARAGLGPDELWLRYVALGGSLSSARLVSALAGELVLDADHDCVAHALNEFFTERGDDYAVAYAPD